MKEAIHVKMTVPKNSPFHFFMPWDLPEKLEDESRDRIYIIALESALEYAKNRYKDEYE